MNIKKLYLWDKCAPPPKGYAAITVCAEVKTVGRDRFVEYLRSKGEKAEPVGRFSFSFSGEEWSRHPSDGRGYIHAVDDISRILGLDPLVIFGELDGSALGE